MKGRPHRRPFFYPGPKWYLGRVKKLTICILLLSAACRDDRPPAPSAEESARLNEAEAMLNGLAANEEGPMDRSTGPSNSSD